MRDKVPHYLKLIQNILEANKQENGFLVGDSLTLADIVLMNEYEWLREHKRRILENFPSLKQHDERIRNIPKIAEHLKKNEGVRLSIRFPN